MAYKHNLTFRFFDTEHEAKSFVKKTYENYSRYLKKAYGMPTYHEHYFKDNSGGWLVWYRE